MTAGARAQAAGVAADAVARAAKSLGGVAVSSLRPSQVYAAAGAKYALVAPDGPHARSSWAQAVRNCWAADFGDTEAGRLALDLLESARTVNSNKNYDSKLRLFFEFCGSRVPCVDPLQATSALFIEYIAWHGVRGRVRMDRAHFQPYMSAVNTFLRELKLPRIACGSKAIDNALASTARRQRLAPGVVAAARRVYMPAKVMAAMVLAAELATDWRRVGSMADELTALRPLLATVMCFQYFDRPHTSVGARWGDFSVSLDGLHDCIHFFERDVKVNLNGVLAARSVEVPVGASAANMQRRLAGLLARFIELKLAVCPEFCVTEASRFWAISGDTRCASWSSTVQNVWLQSGLQTVSASPPANFVWQAQSLRKGAASAASAVNVPLPKIKYMGGWAASSNVPEKTYIDPTCPRDDAALEFFGFLA